MGMTINDMTPASGLAGGDLFEIFQALTQTSKRVSADDIKNYVASNSNGALRGVMTKDLDECTGEDVGVWKWSGTRDDLPGISYAVVEIIRHEASAGTDPNYDIVQRLNVPTGIYQRVKTSTASGTWTPFVKWNATYSVLYGSAITDSDGKKIVEFGSNFLVPPVVLVQPVNDSIDIIFTAQVYNKSVSSFTTKIGICDIAPLDGSGDPEDVSLSLSIDFDNKQFDTNFTDVANYINRYCKFRPEEIAFDWIAIAPTI